MPSATYRHKGDTIDYTPSTAKSAGEIVILGDIVGIAINDIPAGVQGALDIHSVYAFPKKEEAMEVGDVAYWNAAGDPYGGTAGSGAAEVLDASDSETTFAAYTKIGVCTKDAAATDEKVEIRIER